MPRAKNRPIPQPMTGLPMQRSQSQGPVSPKTPACPQPILTLKRVITPKRRPLQMSTMPVRAVRSSPLVGKRKQVATHTFDVETYNGEGDDEIRRGL